MEKKRTFLPIATLSRRWQLSEIFIWQLSITGWRAANGELRTVARQYGKWADSMFAEEDIQSWVDSHPAAYAARKELRYDCVTAQSHSNGGW